MSDSVKNTGLKAFAFQRLDSTSLKPKERTPEEVAQAVKRFERTKNLLDRFVVMCLIVQALIFAWIGAGWFMAQLKG